MVLIWDFQILGSQNKEMDQEHVYSDITDSSVRRKCTHKSRSRSGSWERVETYLKFIYFFFPYALFVDSIQVGVSLSTNWLFGILI